MIKTNKPGNLNMASKLLPEYLKTKVIKGLPYLSSVVFFSLFSFLIIIYYFFLGKDEIAVNFIDYPVASIATPLAAIIVFISLISAFFKWDSRS